MNNTPELDMTRNAAPEQEMQIYSDISCISDTSTEREANNNSEQAFTSGSLDIRDNQYLQVRSGISDTRDVSIDFECQEEGLQTCWWVDRARSKYCLLQFQSTMTLSHHVNSVHIEGDRGNQRQVCYWAGCKRGFKPLFQRKVTNLLVLGI